MQTAFAQASGPGPDNPLAGPEAARAMVVWAGLRNRRTRRHQLRFGQTTRGQGSGGDLDPDRCTVVRKAAAQSV